MKDAIGRLQMEIEERLRADIESVLSKIANKTIESPIIDNQERKLIYVHALERKENHYLTDAMDNFIKSGKVKAIIERNLF